MDLLPELFEKMIYYLSLDDLVELRVAAKEPRDYIKEYKGHCKEIEAYPGYLDPFLQSFPNIPHLNITRCDVKVADFRRFGHLKSLTTSIRPLETVDIFSSCPNLDTLELVDQFPRPNLETNLVFQSLTHLKSLTIIDLECITDHALLYLPLLEELKIVDHSGITSAGIQSLKHLKRLSVETPIDHDCSNLTDEAFLGLGIQKLSLYKNSKITDTGIAHLTQLRQLFCVSCPLIHGETLSTLPSLKIVGMEGTTIYNVRHFSKVKVLTFRDCRIAGRFEGDWPALEKIRLYNSILFSVSSILKMNAPLLKQLRYELCGQLKEKELRKVFGSRVQPL